ncbi:predicted protein [Botrytis cinerea T4]|uniref:Uncharacterized protein n=1 Tax=Botryotinia fuckeliana (strain T4) TaxID=999810 RepID=G2YZ23_BOTF4|nr:predicted protein [Botrytis cinerea T4]
MRAGKKYWICSTFRLIPSIFDKEEALQRSKLYIAYFCGKVNLKKSQNSTTHRALRSYA